jgi:predicted transcriptional regulator
MSEKRNRLEIVAEILKIANRGSHKTRLVYGANLNFKMLKNYINSLENVGLIITSQNNDGLIRTTRKGREYLQQFQALQQISP